eukprot:9397475-Pyramimonas_sp.AAC.1
MGTQTGEHDEQVLPTESRIKQKESLKPKRKQASILAASNSTLRMEAMIAATTCQDSDRILWRPEALSLSSLALTRKMT